MVYKVNKADVVHVMNEKVEVENVVEKLNVDVLKLMADDENDFEVVVVVEMVKDSVVLDDVDAELVVVVVGEMVKDLVVLDDVDVDLVENVHEDYQV